MKYRTPNIIDFIYSRIENTLLASEARGRASIKRGSGFSSVVSLFAMRVFPATHFYQGVPPSKEFYPKPAPPSQTLRAEGGLTSPPTIKKEEREKYESRS